MLGNLIGGFIVIIVGLSLAPTIANEVYDARYNTTGGTGGENITGAASTILGLTTLFYCLSIASAGIGIATVGLRNAGVM
jgi:hypothetical protein